MPGPGVTWATYPDLAGKVAVVTGGSKGIGAATCRALAANGARVVVNGRSRESIEALVAELGPSAIGVAADASTEAGVAELHRQVTAQLGPADLVVPFAGGFGAFTPVQETSADEFRSILESNLTSTFLTVRAFLPAMLERRSGSIVTMSSISGRFLDKPTTAAYAAAKAGITMFTRHRALEVGPQGVRANCVAPATTTSERIERIMTPAEIERVGAMSPLGRMGTPDDTASATIFLLSESASWLTGVTIDVAGGRVML
jgi:3-oxoacyl-[acyl-carrier protein] reductase